MLRRFLSSQLKTLAAASSSSLTPRSASAAARFSALSRSYRYFSTQSGALSFSFFIFSFSNCFIDLLVLFILLIEDATAIKKKVEDVMPIATGHEREELEAELEVSLSLPLSLARSIQSNAYCVSLFFSVRYFCGFC